jgi:hypothetical protein
VVILKGKNTKEVKNKMVVILKEKKHQRGKTKQEGGFLGLGKLFGMGGGGRSKSKPQPINLNVNQRQSNSMNANRHDTRSMRTPYRRQPPRYYHSYQPYPQHQPTKRRRRGKPKQVGRNPWMFFDW